MRVMAIGIGGARFGHHNTGLLAKLQGALGGAGHGSHADKIAALGMMPVGNALIGQLRAKHLQNHFKLYGFIRNYFIFDSRESVSGTGDLFYYLPKDVNMNKNGTEDLNASPSFRFLALTSRVGMDVSGYHIGNVHLGAKVEGDFLAHMGEEWVEKKLPIPYFVKASENLIELFSDSTVKGMTISAGGFYGPQCRVLRLKTGTATRRCSTTPLRYSTTLPKRPITYGYVGRHCCMTSVSQRQNVGTL